MMFFLGAHHPNWLATAGVPLFVSRNALKRYKTLPRAIAPWALDSGGFTEIAKHGGWTIGASEYAEQARRFRDEIGRMEWAAPQDWMCEPDMLKRTGLTVLEHQTRTVANYLELRSIAPDMPWIPVLQGWSIGEYHRHVEAYERAGVELDKLPTVGVGTVCRRQNTLTASVLLSSLADQGLRLHGFGLKLTGLRASAGDLVSADSMAWSDSGRRNPPLPGHALPGPGRPRGHKNCANCVEYAMSWRDDVLDAINEAKAA